MARSIYPILQNDVTDWQGRVLPKACIDHLFPSCVVRLAVRDYETGVTEAIYFRIMKIKDGTFWGKTEMTYRIGHLAGMGMVRFEDGQQFTWRREHINEIPMEKFLDQPKAYRKKVAGLRGKRPEKGYFPTGLRGL